MDTNTHATADSDRLAPSEPLGHLDHTPYARQALGRAKALVAAYGALSIAVLATVVVLALTERPVTSFMWGRSLGVLASAAVTYWLTVLAGRGARWAYLRVRIISIVMPPVIIAIDVLPGTLPTWFVLLQSACALAVAAAAFPLNAARLRAAFPKSP
ncbi:hypothetical protein [Streptomyces olivaceiscleroticus]|uniref:Integral membrane protein n=1 Tax=Streptomyces olivaceiscleroticus TaxID=68245 RepID=A0ABN0ZIX2_9ACTN